MSTFQLDQNIDDSRVVQACSAEGHGEAVRLPPSLRNALDPELLSVVMVGPCPLVTLDRSLPREHAAHIPDRNPGMVVVTNYPKRFQTMTSRIALRVLANLKCSFPAWYDCPLANSILEVTGEGVAVGHVLRGVYITDGYFEFTADTWPAALQTVLQQNATRILPALPG